MLPKHYWCNHGLHHIFRMERSIHHHLSHIYFSVYSGLCFSQCISTFFSIIWTQCRQCFCTIGRHSDDHWCRHVSACKYFAKPYGIADDRCDGLLRRYCIFCFLIGKKNYMHRASTEAVEEEDVEMISSL